MAEMIISIARKTMFKKVLILSASAGAGHTRAAQAIDRAIIEMNAAREVRHVDTLEYTNKVFRNLYSKAYIEMVNKMPDVLGWLYDQFDKPWKNERRRLAFDKLNTRPFVTDASRVPARHHHLHALSSGGNHFMAQSQRAARSPPGHRRYGL